MKKGLVMEGGAMRCMFTAGVIDTLMKEKVVFDGAVGVSAGAAFGCNYKSEQIGRVLRYNVKYASDPRLSSWHSWFKTGDLYGADFCYRELPVELDVFDTSAFQKNPMDFWCVATDINNGEAVYHKLISGKEADLQWIRASSSIPVFARPVEIGNRKYWDGGISDSIPIKFFEKIGYQKNVVILTQPLSYRKEASKLYPALELLLNKYPAVLGKLKTRARDYNCVLDYLRKKEVQGKILVIRPPYPLDIGTMEKNPEELKRVYNVGVKEAKKNLKAVRAYLAE
ncbi:MAG: patatin family protein [Lactobacillus sp.]|uniref:patatin-like phospholipase family protein n=1 Tax=Lactobacillus sp. TaxID=1591 RepID=UPI0023BFAFC7|nr:patatin family protein [Lactobacillus sp.]MDE7051134.1 patatin family protein [Lactobacillus sp.]